MTCQHRFLWLLTRRLRVPLVAGLWGLAILAIVAVGPASAQEPTQQEPVPVVDELVEEALQRNLDLEQQSLALDQSDAAVVEARGGFFPQLDVQARYTRAGGGRTIDFPVGDLLNPVYQTLNTLTSPDAPAFSSVNNQEIRFLRDPEQDTRLRFRQPIFAPAALYGYRAQKDQRRADRAATASTRRAVVRDVQVAYFRYRSAEQQVQILEATRKRVEENLRASRRLVDADRATPDVAFRAEAEVLAVEQRLAEAAAGRRRARSALNQLLDRPLDTPIAAPRMPASNLVERQLASVRGRRPDTPDKPSVLPALPSLQASAQADRPELTQLSASLDAVTDQRRRAQTRYLPLVSLVLEGGIQGTEYGFDDQQRFGLASVVLQWNLFNGLRDRAQIRQADLEAQQIRVRRDAVSRQIDLQVQNALDDVRVAQRSLRTAEARVTAARSSFRLTKRRYDEGRAPLVAFTDAQSTLTEAELNLAVTRFSLLTRLAELRYAAGLRMTDRSGP